MRIQFSFLLLIITLISCAPKKNHYAAYVNETKRVPIFITMPENSFVFENIAPVVYQEIAHHFIRVGYKLTNNKNHGYSLKITIKDLSPVQKYISPDMLLFHSKIKLELLCQLYNFAGKLVRQKTFCFSTLISKARNPILNSSFLEFEYKKLMMRSAPQVEQHFRPLLQDVKYGI